MPQPQHLGFHQERALGDLGQEERFVVAALRAWSAGRHPADLPVADAGASDMATPDWRSLFGKAGIAPVGAYGFDQLLCVLMRRSPQPPEIKACRCQQVSADEETLLALVGTLQCGDVFGSVGALCTWLPETTLSLALRGGQSFAEQLLAADIVLPGGPACLPEPMEARNAPWLNGPGPI
ncbi:hypothetical protein [Roseicella frigidaeris]|uniref:Uncharacterized protein n=1 Tax=Roseicella frigidaeris TaxID=2230885 RepID=A0A327MEA7_9PROT|nr:hypothetical protein [Roseicella frigidaeris]RAI60726.1 hypothetical protein DOO78_00910 [Roseicella frigidaeris]